jgi:serine protease Do
MLYTDLVKQFNERNMKSTFNTNTASRVIAGFLGGAFLLAATSVVWNRHVLAGETAKVIPVTVSVSETPLHRDAGNANSFAPIIKKVAPSVVMVDITTKSKTVEAPDMPSGNDDMLRRFFGQQFGQGGGGGHRTYRTPKEYGAGSGVIVDKDGYIITNNHVVENADTIKVTLNDGRVFNAKVVGRDPKTDVAVIKVDGKNLPFITLADSEKIEVGDVCLAIGNPFGIGQTVTKGIVSAMGRGSVGVGTDYEDFIQTDAAINPGNSGGALVDAEGRLIGINTAILSRSGGNQGIGFAVPVNMARHVMESLIANGKVVRGYMGVMIQNLNPELAKQFSLPNDQGALIGDVSPKGPADKAGFKSGDVVLEFNHKAVTDSRHLRLQVADTAPGASVPVQIMRDGKKETLSLTVKELPGSEQIAKNDSTSKDNSDSLNGVTVSDIDGRARNQLELPQNIKGAVITDVDQDSPAYEAGLRPGDVIVEINRKPVTNADQAVKMTENVKDKTVLVKVWSKGGSRYVVVDENKVG